jgi:hypothetical protein
VSDERVDSRLERAIEEFQQYLSDLLPPLVVSETVALLLKCPPDLMAANIYSWLTAQYRTGRPIPISDYLFHAAKKIHLMGEYNLVPPAEVNDFLARMKPMLLSYCPPDEREFLGQNLDRMDEMPTTMSSPVEVVYRQSSAEAARPGTVSDVKEADMHRLSILMQKIEKELRTIAIAGQPPSSHKKEELVSEALAQAARNAQMNTELESALTYLRRLGINAGTEDVFRALGQNLPEWSGAGRTELPIPEDSNLKAMRRIISQAQDPKEGAHRFYQMANAAVERFNEGHLGQAATIFDLAEKIIAAKEVEEAATASLRRRGHENLDEERLRKYAEAPEHHRLLRKVLNFFEALTPQELFESLRREPKRDRRKLILSLLESHREFARTAALEHLKTPMPLNAANEEIHFRRNLLYLLRRIPVQQGDQMEEITETVARHADLALPNVIVREAVAYLGHLRSERAEMGLISLLEDIEATLPRAGESSYSPDELLHLLDRIAAALARLGTSRANKALINHAFKKKPKLGDTMVRLKEFSNHDLSGDMTSVDMLLSALKAHTPAKVFGFVIQKKDQDLVCILEALSSTAIGKVRTALEDLAQRFPDRPAGQTAAAILTKQSQSGALKKPETGSSLSGDLDLFGLPGLLQSLGDNIVTGNLTLKNANGEVFAAIALEKGKIRKCEAGPLSDDAAIYQLIERPRPGTFHFTRNSERGEDPLLLKEILPLILEGIRRYDELQQAQAAVPDDIRLIARNNQPTAVPEEKDGLLFREMWNAVRNGATPPECEAIMAVDAYRVRRLLFHWLESGSIEAII